MDECKKLASTALLGSIHGSEFYARNRFCIGHS